MSKNFLQAIRLVVVDVDGTMTDGGIIYDQNGNELKVFCSKDAAGYFTAHAMGMKIMVLTGRECNATTRRMQEMDIDYICQNVKDKYDFMQRFMHEHEYKREEVAYIGDDLNDLYSMSLAGYVGCPSDAYPEIKEMADYISDVKGGKGAVRDFICHILKERGEWDKAYRKAYNIPEKNVEG